MHQPRSRARFGSIKPLRLILLSLGLGMPLLMPAYAATDTATAGNMVPSQIDQARCVRNAQTQDPNACLRELAAARVADKSGDLDTRVDDLAANALRRCERMPDTERAACEALALSEARSQVGGELTTQTGSVEAGGIYRETRRITAVPATPVPNDASTPSPESLSQTPNQTQSAPSTTSSISSSVGASATLPPSSSSTLQSPPLPSSQIVNRNALQTPSPATPSAQIQTRSSIQPSSPAQPTAQPAARARSTARP